MAIFEEEKNEKRNRGRSRQPAESGLLNRTVVGSIWTATDDEDRTRYHWASPDGIFPMRRSPTGPSDLLTSRTW